MKETKKATKQVTKNQAASNQNEFMTLGKEADALEIRPHVLRPECKDFDRVAQDAEALPDPLGRGVSLRRSTLRRAVRRAGRSTS